MAPNNVLIYLLRRDLRVEDNPIFTALADSSSHSFTHLLPLYIFAAQQIEVSGFIPKESTAKSPYPEARSPLANFWRCGPHRAKFLAESVWDVKERLGKVGSDLEIRAGMIPEVIKQMLDGFSSKGKMQVGGVWMTSEEGVEEKREERAVRSLCEQNNIDFKLFTDEKYLVDDRDVPFGRPQDLPDVFTAYRKMVEPLRKTPRQVLPAPTSLPPLPQSDLIPAQHQPFAVPTTLEELKDAVLRPISNASFLTSEPLQTNTASAHPFTGGETEGHKRINHLLETGSMTSYKSSRNGLLGTDFSTKLSAWLALGSVTARQVHEALLAFEDGNKQNLPPNVDWQKVNGFGKGENDGTKAVRFELLWRDYMRLCTRKFGPKLFRISGFRNDTQHNWRYPNKNPDAAQAFDRVLGGTTGMGLIDASQREIFFTGYTSNRARQNVASFIAKHLNLDWRLGAEYYECMLVDYDVSSNWGNWQYVSGVGNDPRGEARVFNPVKQAHDYDKRGEYVLAWVQELADADAKLREKHGHGLQPNEIFQAWEISEDRRKECGLQDVDWVNKPLKRIPFTVGRRNPNGQRGGRGRGGGGGGGYRGRGGGGGGDKGNLTSSQARGGYGGAGYGSGGGNGYNGRGYGQAMRQEGGYGGYGQHGGGAQYPVGDGQR